MGVLFLRIIHNRRYRDIGRGYVVSQDEWDPRQRTIKLPGKDPARTSRLQSISEAMKDDNTRMDSIIALLSAHGEYTPDDIVVRFRATRQENTMLSYTAILKEYLTADDRHRTARAYISAAKSLVSFTGKDIPLGEITAALIRAYERYLFDKGLKMNTVSFYMRNLRAIYYRAVKAGIITRQPNNPFEDVYTGVFETRRRSLDHGQMNRLTALESVLNRKLRDRGRSEERDQQVEYLQTLRLKEALMYFMFAFHSRGMSFVDLAYLRKSDLSGDTLIYKRRKTGFFMEVKVTRPMKKIINHFKKQTGGSPYVFPIIRDETDHRRQYETGLSLQNRLLKTLAGMACIYKTLSTHVARHTWATMAKRMGYSIPVISEGLGHRDTKVTSIYLDSFGKSTLDELSTRLSKAVNAA